MRKLLVDSNMVVLNIIEDRKNLMKDGDGFKFLKNFDPNVRIGDTVDLKGNIKSYGDPRIVPTIEEREQHFNECVASGEYVIGEGNLINSSGVEICPIIPTRNTI